MAWNKDLPSGSKDAVLLDDDIRTNNAALETALDEEHAFSTSGAQTGKHTFAVETEATRDADSDYAAGSVSITTDTVSGEYVFTFTHDGTTWHTPLSAFLENANKWVAGQDITPYVLTPAASIVSNWTWGTVFTVTLDQDSTLANPTLTASQGSVRFYVITNDSTPRTLAFGSYFRLDGETGSTGPTINAAADSVSVLIAVQSSNTTIEISMLTSTPASSTELGITRYATDAEAAAGTEAAAALTPDNLGQNFDDTAQDSFVEILGSGMLIQGITVTLTANPQQHDLPTAFASASYVVVASCENRDADKPDVIPIDADTVEISVGDNTPNRVIHVIAFGPKP